MDNPPPPQQIVKRRQTHKVVEKRRRDRQRDSIEALRSRIPSLSGDIHCTVEIICEASKYIDHLHKQILELQTDMQKQHIPRLPGKGTQEFVGPSLASHVKPMVTRKTGPQDNLFAYPIQKYFSRLEDGVLFDLGFETSANDRVSDLGTDITEPDPHYHDTCPNKR